MNTLIREHVGRNVVGLNNNAHKTRPCSLLSICLRHAGRAHWKMKRVTHHTQIAYLLQEEAPIVL